MNSELYLLISVLLVAGFFLYFKIARSQNIVDLPNHRTMHEGATIRGGGIVVLVAMILFSFFIKVPGYFFITGLSILGFTGFLDDLYDLSGKVRFPLQMISVIFLLAELDLLGLNWLLLVVIIILATGILNAFNFMDGINGMTGGYSLVITLSLLYVNNWEYKFISNDFLFVFLLALIVFNIFNFRKKAVCFAGDVGSLSVAFVIVYLLMKLIIETHQFVFLLFLTLYGIDTIFTIVQRIHRRENIFEAHKLHLFQVAISKTGMPHLRMSMMFMGLQAIINLLILFIVKLPTDQQVIASAVLLLFLSIVYVIVKRKMLVKTI